MAPTLGGGTQDTDLSKGFTKGIFTKIFGEEMGGAGGPRPPYINKQQDTRQQINNKVL